MTSKNLVENLRLMFPRAGKQLILKELNTAQRTFVGETRILRGIGELTNITTNLSFILPNNFKSLISINYYDSSDDPIYQENLDIVGEVHDVEGTKKLTFRSITSTPLTVLPSSISSIQIEYYKYPQAITTTSSTVDLEEEYRDVLELMVAAKLHRLFPKKVVDKNGNSFDRVDMREIGLLKAEIDAYKRKAIIQRNVGADDRNYNVLIYDYAGEQYLSKRSKVTPTTTIIQGEDVSYTKRFRVTVVDTGDYTIDEASGWTSDPTVAVIPSPPSVVISSTGEEFTIDPATWVRNNQGAGFTWDNAGQITVHPSASWGTMEVEVFIY